MGVFPSRKLPCVLDLVGRREQYGQIQGFVQMQRPRTKRKLRQPADPTTNPHPGWSKRAFLVSRNGAQIVCYSAGSLQTRACMCVTALPGSAASARRSDMIFAHACITESTEQCWGEYITIPHATRRVTLLRDLSTILAPVQQYSEIGVISQPPIPRRRTTTDQTGALSVVHLSL